MRLHLWDRGAGDRRTFCGRGRLHALGVAVVRKVGEGMLVHQCSDDIADILCKRCSASLTRRIGGWVWKRVRGGEWLAMTVAGKGAA